MPIRSLIVVAAFLLPCMPAAAQLPPVFESYLARNSIYHAKDGGLTVEALFRKYHGTPAHKQHQMYILLYMKQDEAEIAKIATTPEYLVKENQAGPKFFDILLEKKLVITLDTRVASKRDERSAKHEDGREVTNKEIFEGKSSLDYFSFPFEFTFSQKLLLDSLEQLPSFRAAKIDESDSTHFGGEFRLMAFVPVNDCSYADKVEPNPRKRELDYAKRNKIKFTEPGGAMRTPIVLWKPLPYDLSFYKSEGGKLAIYVN